MTKNPFYNALFAIAYIVVLVTGIFLSTNFHGFPQESFIYPMVMLSLLVLSVALMAYLFFYQPILMLLDGYREKAVKLFLQTIGIFAIGIVLLLLCALVISR
ncbi:hypothetical protein FJY93_01400 [Candidatus Kaiserbacteria bacterium]|nr:hypothetical protein [Candidatus Kaiserbacteria bacterium]